MNENTITLEMIWDKLNHFEKKFSSLTHVPEDDRDLLTQKEAAKFLKCTPQTLISWRSAGKISAKRIGRKIFYSKSELMQVMSGRLVGH